MKTVRFVRPLAFIILCYHLVSCNNGGSMNGSRDGRYGASRAVLTDDPEMYGPEIIPGRYLQTISPSSVFFNHYPSIEDRPDRILPSYTDVKVVSVKGSYVKVELINTGAVGYVPSMMLGEKRALRNTPVIPQEKKKPLVPDISPDVIDPSRPAE